MVSYDHNAPHDEDDVEKLCFTLCLDTNFIPGAVGTINSIRKFYTASQADIVVFLDRPSEPFRKLCAQAGADLHYFSEIWSWLKPQVYDDPRYANNSQHYYHPEFQPVPGLDCSLDRGSLGFETLRHLHPLNVKAYCTGYCLCVKNYKYVVHIDTDAFLLAPIDEMFARHDQPDTVIGFEDKEENLDNLETLFGVSKPADFSNSAYGFNAGVMLYVNGPAVKQLMRDFMFYVESCYHYTHAGHFADQGVLRALVAAYHLEGRIHFYREDAVNWNPTWNRADDLQFDAARQVWVNRSNGQVQHVWHGAGGEKLWSGKYDSPSVNRAWQWVGGSYANEWMRELPQTQQFWGGAMPYYDQVLENDNYVNKLCFTSCLNENYVLAAEGMIQSIRRFYTPEEADIIIFVDQDFRDFRQFCAEHAVELRYFSEIDEWVTPLVYDDPRYANDSAHYYHPDFQPVPGIDHNTDRVPGFGTIHHLHPLNVKAYCTGYCLCVKNYKYVVHIDTDAFLLAPIDEMFARHDQPDTVIGFEDDEDELPKLETLFFIPKPPEFHRSQYGFNAGIVFYVNGRGTKALLRDFMFYMESCYHYTHAGTYNDADQGLLRVLVAKHSILGNIRFCREDNVNWNPTWRRAEQMLFDLEQRIWINLRNNQKQFIWHSPAKERVWTGCYPSSSANAAWRWVGGTYNSWPSRPRSFPMAQCELAAQAIADFFGEQRHDRLEGLELGLRHGRNAVAVCTLLRQRGFDLSLDTCDLPEGEPPAYEGRMHPLDVEQRITLHQVGEHEDLISRFRSRHFSFVYINSCALSRDQAINQVGSNCAVAINLAKEHTLVLGNGYDVPAIRETLELIFGRDIVRGQGDQWFVPIGSHTLGSSSSTFGLPAINKGVASKRKARHPARAVNA